MVWRACRFEPVQLQRMRSWRDGLHSHADDCSLSCNESCPGGVDSCSECGPKITLIAVPTRFDFRPLHLTFGFRRAPLAARRPASRCSVARALELHRLEGLQAARSGRSRAGREPPRGCRFGRQRSRAVPIAPLRCALTGAGPHHGIGTVLRWPFSTITNSRNTSFSLELALRWEWIMPGRTCKVSPGLSVTGSFPSSCHTPAPSST